jgi:hypothetical protein
MPGVPPVGVAVDFFGGWVALGIPKGRRSILRP